jgi:ubiquinone/menaquinone biosynthesis C-methylase UbiE
MRTRTETQAFFAERAARWDTRFGDDLPAYAAAIASARLRPGGTAVDVGCGTGRALPILRDALGPAGPILGLDVTPEMLTVAAPRAAAASATLALADASALPLAPASVDALVAAGLINHLPDAPAAFAEFARVARPGASLILFHPIGRAALAARHGHTLRPDEPLAPGPLRDLTHAAGWDLTAYDDAEDRFLALAVRR